MKLRVTVFLNRFICCWKQPRHRFCCTCTASVTDEQISGSTDTAAVPVPYIIALDCGSALLALVWLTEIYRNVL